MSYEFASFVNRREWLDMVDELQSQRAGLVQAQCAPIDFKDLAASAELHNRRAREIEKIDEMLNLPAYLQAKEKEQ